MVEMSDVVGAEYTFAKHEHAELKASLDEIHAAAAAIGRTSPERASGAVRRIRNWLATVLVPHAAWEDAIVYPEIEERIGTDWATKLMRYEHFQIERAAAKLDGDLELLQGGLTHEQLCEIRGHLLGLEMLLRAHVEREELFLLPVLDR
jgi:hypothetical protein